MTKSPLPAPEEPWDLKNLKTFPWLEAAGWKGLESSAQDSLYKRGSLFLVLDKPDPAGNVLLLILVASDGSQPNRAETEYVCIGLQPHLYLRDLYPDHDWSPWLLRGPFHEPLDGPYDEVRLHFLQMIEDCGWPDSLEKEDQLEPYERFVIRDPEHFYGSTPAPGETVGEYEDRLLYGEPDTGMDIGICREFVRDKDRVWFASGGDECFGQELCQWHSGMDAIYAAGSSTIANVGVPLDVLEEAIQLMDRNAKEAQAGQPGVALPYPYEAAHARCLSLVMKAALDAQPSEEIQSYGG